MGDASNWSGTKRPDQFRLGYVALHLDECAVCVHGAAPKFGPAFQQIVPRVTAQTADNAQAGLHDPLRAIFVPVELAIIAHARKHLG